MIKTPYVAAQMRFENVSHRMQRSAGKAVCPARLYRSIPAHGKYPDFMDKCARASTGCDKYHVQI